MLPCKWVSSYLAFPSLPCEHGGLFLLHFPGGYPRLMLSAILPYEARTFLTVIPFGDIQRDRSAELSGILYHIFGDLSMVGKIFLYWRARTISNSRKGDRI